MKKIEPEKIINYWRKTAQHDFEAMNDFFKIRRYIEALFYGHIVLEKILKACVVQQTKIHAPYSHDLVKLAKIATLDLNQDEINLLHEVNKFNIRARYPDYKLSIYKKCTKEYTDKFLKRITALYNSICKKLE